MCASEDVLDSFWRRLGGVFVLVLNDIVQLVADGRRHNEVPEHGVVFASIRFGSSFTKLGLDVLDGGGKDVVYPVLQAVGVALARRARSVAELQGAS